MRMRSVDREDGERVGRMGKECGERVRRDSRKGVVRLGNAGTEL